VVLLFHLEVKQQKNMMEHSWAPPVKFKYSKRFLGGAGTQTAAALSFGGLPQQVLGATEEYNGISWVSNPGLV
jgi:hypothetical protein